LLSAQPLPLPLSRRGSLPIAASFPALWKVRGSVVCPAVRVFHGVGKLVLNQINTLLQYFIKHGAG
jgi:hypothetical protein